MSFPATRMRRLRGHATLRSLVAETAVTLDDLVMPLFVAQNLARREEIPGMPGQFRHSLDSLADHVKSLRDCGVKAVILFGIPTAKDETGSGAYAPDGIVQQALARLRRDVPEMYLMGDVCLCEYTSHGHCGLVKDGCVRNDATLELLAKTAVSQVEAGAHLVAPSDMADGRVGAIRAALDEAGFPETPIMSYAAKYASAYYGPFRDAAGSAPAFGDRRSYQMDPSCSRQALREVALDVEEGADIVMVKPALAYLDIIHAVRERFDLPVAAYNVSGEYSMVKLAAAHGLINEEAVVRENLLSMKRAGADIILSYHTESFARQFQRQ